MELKDLEFKELGIKGVFEIRLHQKQDERGFFMKTYNSQMFLEKGLNTTWVQENHSFSKHKGVLRGLHFQYPPFAETKLVRVARGEVFVVVVDIKTESDSFGQWYSTVLSAEHTEKMIMLYIPEGFAMGMCTLTENCSLLYKMGREYAPEHQGEIVWDDQDLNIPWPTKIPILSERDKNAMSFKEYKEKIQGTKGDVL